MKSHSDILPRILKKLKKEPLEYFVAFVCVIGNGAWPSVENTKIYTAILIIVLIIYRTLRVRKLHIGEWLIPISFLIMLPILSTIFKLSSNSNVVNLIATTVLITVLSLFNITYLKKILDKYSEIIVGLALIAVFMKILLMLIPSLYHLAAVKNTKFGYYYNFYIYTAPKAYSFRSQGIFWEPGVWSINQMFSLAWYVLYKKNVKIYPLFLVSMLFTMSTTGLALLGIISIYIFFFSEFKINRVKVILITFISILVVTISIPVLFAQYDTEIGDFIYMQTIGKVTQKNKSLENRLEATEKTWKITKENPFFGVGRSTNVYVTSAILQILYQTGFPFFIIYFIAFCRVFKKMTLILAILFVLVMLNGEALAFLSLYSIFVVFGSKLLFLDSKEQIIETIYFKKIKLIKVNSDG